MDSTYSPLPNPPPVAPGNTAMPSTPGPQRFTSYVLRFRSPDWLAIGLIAVSYIAVALIFSPGRDFALIDDWAYTRAVEKVMDGQGFAPLQVAQATAVTHTYWGALFDSIFGVSFTSVTLATIVMSV